MLNRPRRQVLFTLAVFALSVVPTAYVCFTGWQVNRPGHASEIAASIGRQLAVAVEVTSVKHPRPLEDVLRGVVLRQEELGKAAARGMEFARADTVRVFRGARELTLKAEALRLHGEGPNAALTQIGALLLRAGGPEMDRINLSSHTCVIELGQGPNALTFKLRDVAAVFRADRLAPSISASYFLASDDPRTRCEFTLVRDRREATPTTTLTFKTMDGPVPASVLAPFCDVNRWLGALALLEGTLSLKQGGTADWQATFEGELHNVDLATLFVEHFTGHRLSGQARLAIESAHWSELPGGQGSGWTALRGTIIASRGAISQSLLRALETEMRFRLAGPTDEHEADIEFSSLGLGFALTADGEIRLTGGLGPEFPPDAVLVQAHHALPLARAPEGAANVRGLWKTLFSSHADVLVPATPQSHVLRYLPLPPAVAERPRSVQAN